ncbi:WxL domain-containing protein [Lacticaseibacillus casei]|uniref:WxL domain-containing protein n=1 Tax=Lacticaseibacillus TaxID=2759736 RepID=UPI0006688103|nr:MULTISPECIES: WxL domain-containing protein [Lacticaseibacillus]QVI38504.1 WxL domain-containing protein [Lacticaseibacillus casei]QXG60316.1 WxL domain-containing protein [Lacticaseibacillus casei]WFB42629.1 WxL domain-containing protein [Lacticaseibacillus huelsenbergensis]
MRKINYIVTGISALTLAGCLVPTGSVFAANDTKTSVAEVNILPGDINLDKVPDLHFGTINIGQITAGNVDLKLDNNTIDATGPVKDGTNAMDGNADGELTVSDNRGTSAGWALTAQLGDMKDSAGRTLNGSLTLKTADVTTDNPTLNAVNPTAGTTLDFGGGSLPIWKADALATGTNGQGQGKNTALLKKGSETVLHLLKDPTASAGRYQAAITWTLADVPL